MAKSEMIRARVEPALKHEAEAVLDKLGMTPTEAITLFYKQVTLYRGLPFPVRYSRMPRRARRFGRRAAATTSRPSGPSAAWASDDPFALSRLDAPRCAAAGDFARTSSARSAAARTSTTSLPRLNCLPSDGALAGRRIGAHKLSGEWSGVWECHIEPDWLLIYAVTDEEVLLIRTGTHADQFT